MAPKKKVPARRAPTDDPAPKAATTTAIETPKRRGRPPKTTNATTISASPKQAIANTTPVKAARGRPKKNPAVEAGAATKSSKRRRDEEELVSAPPKKRGRPAKVDTTVTKPRKTLAERVQKNAPKPKAAVKPAAKRGRPAKSAVAAATTKPKASKPAKKAVKSKIHKNGAEAEAEDFVEGLTQEYDQQESEDYQYWLMKAEPTTRIEKGKDVAYPIDKLEQATEPEPWDGVRSPIARNNMRAMRKNDLAFFYHSNCDVPGIVGVMRIVEEHSTDVSAFDPTHPYYDEKSDPSKPKWDCVKVEFVKRFIEPITLKELKSTPQLDGMQVAQKSYGRLSVQKVTPAQWRFVLKMANEPEDLGVTSPVSGYEADTNGETDKEAPEETIDESITADDVDDRKIAAYGTPDGMVDDIDVDIDLEHQINGHAAVSNQMDNLDDDNIVLSDEDA